jgi:TetR/AcrR family transcriptional regulator, repressor for uid operon
MPKLKPETQLARREHILDAAEFCFARSGFHRSTMQDICKEAGVSPGALYGHFASKEALIAGIAERDRSKLASELAELATAPDLLAALSRLGEHYTMEEPRHKRLLCIEIGCESTRNDEVREIFQSVDRFAHESFRDLFAKAKAEGKVAPQVDTDMLAQMIAIIGDGLFWRRAVDPEFDANAVMPSVMALVSTLMNPASPSAPAAKAVTTAPPETPPFDAKALVEDDQ